MVLEVTAFADPADHSHHHGAAVGPFGPKNDAAIHQCYQCIHDAKKQGWFRFMKPSKFLERYPSWDAFKKKALQFAPSKNAGNHDAWARETLAKYDKGGKHCKSQCPPKLQQSLPPAFLVSLERVQKRSKNRISSFL